jgi:peptidoglycan lytic transglycosylase
MQSVIHTCPRIAVIGTGLLLALTHPSATYARKVSSDRPVLKTQIGDATFYASHFQGRKTASGRIFDKNKAMAAHRTYPFGTVVRVTNLRNKRSVNVVIVDRGPFGKNRREGAIIDVSPSVAEKLGMLRTGQARVKLEVLVWGNGERVTERPKVVASARR